MFQEHEMRDVLRNELSKKRRDKAILQNQLALANRKLEVAMGALKEARDDMEGWQAYASDYFKEKWDAKADLAKIDTAITTIDGMKE